MPNSVVHGENQVNLWISSEGKNCNLTNDGISRGTHGWKKCLWKKNDWKFAYKLCVFINS